ncbi:hypothetical protein I4U23_016428 [Adineta vaga]|nr:hypothetical protein I4U23_016428 [Adineta vaga]
MHELFVFLSKCVINGKSNLQARVTYTWWGTNQPDDNRAADWALLRLDKKLGTKIVPINIMKQSPGILVGYSVNFKDGQTAGAQMNCRIIKELSSKLFLHDCNAGRGASGGPIFVYGNNKPYIYLLHVAEYRNGGDTTLYLSKYNDNNANIAIWPNELQQKINELIR